MARTTLSARRRLAAGAVALATALATWTAPVALAADDGTSGGRTSSRGNCTMYASGTGMGSYCSTLTGVGGAVPLTLRQRFGGQDYDRCIYDEPLAGVAPTQVKNDHGSWLLRSCLGVIDLDTYNGGDNRRISLSVVWVDDNVDITRAESELNDFLWSTVQTEYPVPIMTLQPGQGIARVNQRAYATFRWVDALRPRDVIAEGPYAGLESGGPYVQERNGDDVTMTAQATKVTLDPAVVDEETVECVGADVNPTYDHARGIDEQDSRCYVTWNRSSANAEELSVDRLPDDVPFTFALKVIVTWRVTYQQGAEAPVDMGEFDMVVRQPVAVRDVDVLNTPLISIAF